MKSIVVFAPHADDEVLGCGGWLINQHCKGNKIHIVYGSIGGISSNASRDVRMAEVKKVTEALGATWEEIVPDGDGFIERDGIAPIVTRIDSVLNRIKPDIALINCPSYHQDHRTLYEAFQSSLRPKVGWVPPVAVMYEYPCMDTTTHFEGGKLYHDIEGTIEGKVRLLELYESQNRPLPSRINSHGVRTLARLRGWESGRNFAELFYLIRDTKYE